MQNENIINAARLALRAAQTMSDETYEDAHAALIEAEQGAMAADPWVPGIDVNHVATRIRVAQLGGSWAHAREVAERALEFARWRDDGKNPLDAAVAAHARALVAAASWAAEVKHVSGCDLAALERTAVWDEIPAGAIVARYETDECVTLLAHNGVEEARHGVEEDWCLLHYSQK